MIFVHSGMPYWQIVQQCPYLPNSGIDETIVCNWSYNMQQQNQYNENNNQPGDQSFPLDVAHYLRKTLKFRIPTIQPQEVITYYYLLIYMYLLTF